MLANTRTESHTETRTVYGELELMQGKIELKIELIERTGVR